MDFPNLTALLQVLYELLPLNFILFSMWTLVLGTPVDKKAEPNLKCMLAIICHVNLSSNACLFAIAFFSQRSKMSAGASTFRCAV